jgi:ribosome-binding factor A
MDLCARVRRDRVLGCAIGRTILKQHGGGSKESLFIDSDFVEALNENDSGRASSRRQVERKTRQFCRQVQRAMNFALADRKLGDGIDGLFVEDVSPAPDCGRLLVRILVPGSVPVNDVMIALGRETPRLRSEVAAAITRKRAPELCFVPAWDGGGYE